MTLTNFRSPLLALLLASLFGTAAASPDHDHSHDAAPVEAGPAAPRFEAQSDLFEVVGILNDDELSVFVDRYADNAPVLKARVEIESGKFKQVGQFHDAHGDYSFKAEAFKKPGTYPISIVVTAGDDADLLAGNLIVPDPHAGEDHIDGIATWLKAVIGAVGLVLAGGLALFIRRRSQVRCVGGLK